VKTLEFGFEPSNLRGAALYLNRVKAKPVLSLPETEALIKREAIARFKRACEGQPVHPYRLSDDALHGAIVWSGLSCTFTAAARADTPFETADVDLSPTFSGELKRVEVEFFTYADAE
jgi:hypothetical protein